VSQGGLEFLPLSPTCWAWLFSNFNNVKTPFPNDSLHITTCIVGTQCIVTVERYKTYPSSDYFLFPLCTEPDAATVAAASGATKQKSHF
jgi:hypothetical protein